MNFLIEPKTLPERVMDMSEVTELISQASVYPREAAYEVYNRNRLNNNAVGDILRRVDCVKLGPCLYGDGLEEPLRKFKFRGYLYVGNDGSAKFCINKFNKIYIDISNNRELYLRDGDIRIYRTVEAELRGVNLDTKEEVDAFFKTSQYAVYPGSGPYAFEVKQSEVSCGIFTCHGLDNIGRIPQKEKTELIVYINRQVVGLVFRSNLVDYIKYKILESELKSMKSSILIFSTNKTRNDFYNEGRNFVQEYFGRYLLVDLVTKNSNSKNDINTWMVDLNAYQVAHGFKKEKK